MTINKPTLYYFHDPMCSWCWAFSPQWQLLVQNLPENINVGLILGGLAPDTDEPMPIAQQQTIEGYWHNIQNLHGTAFNFDFWRQCQPKRSTWIACRAVIVASHQGYEAAMIEAIQKAYYLQARNPSLAETLKELAIGIGLEAEQFSRELNSAAVQVELDKQMAFAQSCGVRGFPSLRLVTQEQFIGEKCFEVPIAIDDYQVSLDALASVI